MPICLPSFAGVAQPAGGVFDGSLIFPIIQVFDTQAEFIDEIDAPDYTLVNAKDTDKLYLWEGNNWREHNQN